MTMIDDKLLTVHDVADQLSVSEYTIRNWLNSGRLKGFRPGGDKAGWRVRASDLHAFIEGAERRQEGSE